MDEVPCPLLCRKSNRMTMMVRLNLAFYNCTKIQSLISLSYQIYTLKLILTPVTCSSFIYLDFFPWSFFKFFLIHCTEWSLTVMQMPMFPWKPLSTTEYTTAIFEPFVHLINYVFVLKAAWLDCLIMY